jgi:hypothetical protein
MSEADDGPRISNDLAFFGAAVERTAPAWVWLGGVESAYLRHELAAVAIERPVYITGLARAGSTVLLELLARHPAVATHQYRDFPPIFTPAIWDWLRARTPRRAAAPTARAHNDRILVSETSPEAMEEPLWMHFFSNIHDPSRCNVLDATSPSDRFRRFYKDHIAKLLLVRDRGRYVAKSNYSLSRLGLLRAIFPDARFLLPVRNPIDHVASLMRQHERFTAAGQRDPRIVRHMRRIGHFEFGLDRRPVNFGNDDATRRVLALWRDGEEVRGWAAYWADVYGFLRDALESDPALREAALVVRYHELCNEPERLLGDVFSHGELARTPEEITGMSARLSAPAYYSTEFSKAEEQIIRAETRAVADWFGVAEARA